MTVYISGPISGMPHKNKKAFSAAYNRINKHRSNPVIKNGFKIINPLRIAALLNKQFAARGLGEPQWSDYMRADIQKLCECDCVFSLNGWAQSDGATMERYIAKRLGIPCADSIEELEKILGVSREN